MCNTSFLKVTSQRVSGDTLLVRKAPHLIKIILANSPKKERADPIEDESEVQQSGIGINENNLKMILLLVELQIHQSYL